MPTRTVTPADPQTQPSVRRQATRSPSSAAENQTLPTPAEEVTTMAQHLRRALDAIRTLAIDVERIDAHRDAVQRELVLSRPIL